MHSKRFAFSVFFALLFAIGGCSEPASPPVSETPPDSSCHCRNPPGRCGDAGSLRRDG